MKLSDVCTKGTSNIAQKDLDARNGDYPIYGASGFIKNVDFYHQENPYIAIVKDGAGVGRVMQLPAKSSVIGTMQYIIPNEDVSVEYLAYALEHMNLSKYYLGAAIPHIYFKDYCNESLPNHTLEEQANISQVLGLVSDLTALRKQQLSKLDELVKSRFIELFGDPVTNEKNWSRLTLGDICEIGSSKRVFEKDYVPQGIPFFRTKEIVELSKGNSISTELFISQEHFAELKKSYGAPKKDDLLISAVGTIGTIWIVSGDFEFYFKDGNLIQIKSSPAFNSIFMKYLLDELIANYKKEMSTGTAYSALTIVGLKKMLVYDVPLVLQEQFATFVEQTDKSKLAVQQSLEKLETLKKSLMQKYFG